ncbi:hypothetical protein GCM10018987_54970 [Streptomyces cremeus]
MYPTPPSVRALPAPLPPALRRHRRHRDGCTTAESVQALSSPKREVLRVIETADRKTRTRTCPGGGTPRAPSPRPTGPPAPRDPAARRLLWRRRTPDTDAAVKLRDAAETARSASAGHHVPVRICRMPSRKPVTGKSGNRAANFEESKTLSCR